MCETHSAVERIAHANRSTKGSFTRPALSLLKMLYGPTQAEGETTSASSNAAQPSRRCPLVHPHLRSLVDTHSSVWARACFQDVWPSPENLQLFERAAECGNFEACLNSSAYPFVWLFIRPPWSASGSCCKAVVFDSLKEECQGEAKEGESVTGGLQGSLQYCLAKVLSLFEDMDLFLLIVFSPSVSPAALPWPAQLVESTGFTLEHLTPCVLLLHKKCFHDDAPKDYRQVSLTAVKQRFQNDLYGHISTEKVMDYSQLCSLLGISIQDSENSTTTLNLPDIHPFLCSPAGNKTKRRREDSLQEDRDSFVTTPTAELSNQEETLLGDFLDWSLDSSCSGYEGDRESEGEREGDVTCPSGILDISLIHPEEHHCQDSSDEDATNLPMLPAKPELSFHSLIISTDNSSGYSSVSSPTTSPNGLPFTPTPGLPHNKLTPIPFPQPSPTHFKASRKQVKRKNQAQHSDENVADPL
ncbi:hypothetical protein AB205_0117590 [Aquarana catesbeiana]|uniref:Cyclin C-terminal domain-containing protein n=1 Tax=Aquarana catesbeiana TaxID=8400 RepID=A0A2G9RXP7_AQUCT|nr:hypothetical protein AB205_0117590 [Aquarana catesbeiana]